MVVWVGVGGVWWIPLHYLVTSENDFRLSEAVTIDQIYVDMGSVHLIKAI